MKKSRNFISDLRQKLLKRKRVWKTSLLLIVTLLIGAGPLDASAFAILSKSTLISGSSWQNSYTIFVEPGDAPVWEFAVNFAPASYANLALVSSPPGWDTLVVQPDNGIPADGYFDALTLGLALNPGDSLGDFVISFDYIGSGVPSRQTFDIIDPLTFATIASGVTTVESVPEPGTLPLLLLGMGAVGSFSRRRMTLRRRMSHQRTSQS